MRVTTNMMIRNYQNNLYSTMGGLESARKQVETHRRYQHSWEAPSAAQRAAVLERRQSRNKDYQNNISNVMKWQDTQEDVVMQLEKQAAIVSKNYSVSAVTDTAGKVGRETYAKALRASQETMVQALNTKYGDSFVFGGNGGTETAPFSLSEDGTKLYYRGVDVSSQSPADKAALEALLKETSYVDLGFGLSYDAAGDLLPSSAFDCAFPGIKAVGYGQTDDGVSKNLIVLMGQMANELEQDTFDREAYSKLWDQFDEGTNYLQDALTTLGTKSRLLQDTESRLKTEAVSIQEQINSEIGIQPAEAITGYSWAMYAYNSALKIGTSIIGPSLLDFLK